jgi:hypothetical protein
MNSDLAILLAAQPGHQVETIDKAPPLPDFQALPAYANDPMRRREIVAAQVNQTARSASGGGGASGSTVVFVVPSNGTFGIIEVLTTGPIITP